MKKFIDNVILDDKEYVRVKKFYYKEKIEKKKNFPYEKITYTFSNNSKIGYKLHPSFIKDDHFIFEKKSYTGEEFKKLGLTHKDMLSLTQYHAIQVLENYNKEFIRHGN